MFKRTGRNTPPAFVEPPATKPPTRALESLYRQHAAWLRSVARRQLGGDPTLAEDVVQSAYLRASRYDDAALNRQPRALLRQIAVNLARDHMRRNVVRGGRSLDLDAGAGTDHPQLSVEPEQEYLLMLKQAVLTLPDKLRDVFVLSRFTGMSNADIAQHFGISIKAVEWRMARALQLCVRYMRD
jgi:RNA polymerase sigma factor (sigma-70 family)